MSRPELHVLEGGRTAERRHVEAWELPVGRWLWLGLGASLCLFWLPLAGLLLLVLVLT
jgi:hypothetical protein